MPDTLTAGFSVPWGDKQRSEFPATTLSATANKNSTNRKKDKVMKIKNTLLGAIVAMTQSKWIRPALMTSALVVAALGVTGCQPHH